MNSETLQIAALIKKPPEERTTEELQCILPFLTSRSELLNNLKSGDNIFTLELSRLFTLLYKL